MTGNRRASLYTLLGYGVWSAFNFLMFASVAKLATPETAGAFALIVAVTTPILDFAQLNTRAIQNTDAEHRFAFADFLGLRLATMSLAILFFIGYAVFVPNPIEVRASLIFFGVRGAVDGFIDTHYGMLQRLGRLDTVGKSMALRGFLGFIAFLAAFWATRSLIAATGVTCLTSILMLVAGDRPAMIREAEKSEHPATRAGLGARFLKTEMKAISLLAAPLAVTILLTSFNIQAGRLILERHLGLHAVGIFGALQYLIVIGRVVIIALGISLSTPLSERVARNDRAGVQGLLLKMLVFCLAIGIALPVLGLLIGAPLLRLVYGPEYAKDPVLFALVLAGGGFAFLSIFLGYGMTALRRLKPQPIIYGLTLITTIGLTLLLVPKDGLYGAAWAALAGNVVCTVLSGVVVVAGVRTLGRVA